LSPLACQKREIRDAVFQNLAETRLALAVLLWPLMPGKAGKTYVQLGLLGRPDQFNTANWGGLPREHPIGESAPLFSRKHA